MSASPARPPAQKRTAHACTTCRARKVRCDGRRDICTNCERLGYTCSYDQNVAVEVVSRSESGDHGTVTAAAAAISIPRRRARQACQSCHAKKARCSGSMPKCDRCRTQGLTCIYRPGKRSLPLPSLPTAASTSDASDVVMMHDDQSSTSDHGHYSNRTTASPVGAAFELHPPEPDEALTLRAFDNYFRFVHHIPMFSFMHRASLMERYHSGQLDRSLPLAIIGIASLLTDLGPGMQEYGARCIDEATALCMREVEKPSILRLKALVIIVKYRIFTKRFPSAFMLHAITSRFASALRLNHENPELCFLARESRRRLMWSLYMIDSGIASGQADFALWPDPERQIRIQLPCNERNFEFDLPEATEPLRPPSPEPGGALPPLPDAVGFLGLHVRMHWMRTRILQATTKTAGTPSAEHLDSLPMRCAEMASELETFEARLPASFRWSESSLRLRTYSPRLSVFAMTHIWWRQCHLDLYRVFLPGLEGSLSPDALARLDPQFVTQSRRKCYEHARAMADMFAQMLSLDNGRSPHLSDIDLPGCAFQCCRILYHGLETAGEELGFTADGVRELATVCLRAARQSTVGPACVSIQADIEKLIASGLQLMPDVPVAVSPNRTRDPDRADGAVPLQQQQEHQQQQQSFMVQHHPNMQPTQQQVPVPTTMPDLVVSTGFQAPPASVAPAPSHASGGTTGSNAFEEQLGLMDGFASFGPDFFATGDAWSTYPAEWLNLGNLPGPG